jgi:hypothetical protein
MSPRMPKTVRVRNFDRFQHGGPKTKDLPWVKLYVSVLTDIDLMSRRPSTFKVAICLLLFAQRTNNRIQTECKTLANSVHLSVRETTEAVHDLLRIGFIEPYRVETQSRLFIDKVAPPTRAHSPSSSSSVSEKEPPQANDLMAHFCERVTRNGDVLTSRARGSTAQEIGKLVREGVPEALIRRALEIQADKGKSPTILAFLVQEAQREGKNGNGSLSVEDIMAIDPVALLAAEETL